MLLCVWVRRCMLSIFGCILGYVCIEILNIYLFILLVIFRIRGRLGWEVRGYKISFYLEGSDLERWD